MAFCSHCIDLNEIPGKPEGSESQIGGVKTYVAKGSSKGSIVIAPDIFGVGIQNPLIVADQLASKSGCSVYVPDYFPGGPIKPEDFILPKQASQGPPSEDQVSKNFDNFGKWMEKKNSPEHSYPIYKSVIEEVKKQNGGGKVGGVGFCYGGKIITLAAIDKIIDSGSIYHPALLESEESEKIKIPILLNQAELDPLFQGEVKEKWNENLKSNNVLDKRSQTYPNTVHGFGSRPDLKDEKVKKGHEQALQNTADFFKETLA